MSWTDLPDFTELLLRLGCAREQIRDTRHKPEKIDGFIPTAPGKILHQLQLVHPEGLGVKALAQAVSLSPGVVSQTVQTLVDAGLIDRATAPNDRRAVVIRLTDEGIRQIHRHEAMMNALLSRGQIGSPGFTKCLTNLRRKRQNDRHQTPAPSGA